MHTINHDQGWACTGYDGGRNKLPGKKRGTRPWNMYVVCTCEGGIHKPPPEDFEHTFTAEGNVAETPFCTVCPLNCMELKKRKTKAELKAEEEAAEAAEARPGKLRKTRSRRLGSSATSRRKRFRPISNCASRSWTESRSWTY